MSLTMGMSVKTRRASRRRAALAAVTSVVTLVAVGCGSSSPSTGSSASKSATYKVMYISDLTGTEGLFTPYQAAFAAAVKSSNARSGVHLDLITCDSQTNANAAAECGQQAVSDHVIAVVSYDEEGTEDPYLEAAKIPDLNIGIGQVSWSSPISFILNDLSVGGEVGFPGLLKQGGCTSFDTLDAGTGNAADVSAAEAEQVAAAKQFDLSFKGIVTAPAGAPDMSAYVTQAVSKGVDCIDLGLTAGAQILSELSALLTQTQIKKIAIAADYLSQPGVGVAADPILAKLGSRLIMLTVGESPTDTSNPKVVQWVKDETRYDPSAPLEAVDGQNWA
jgi:substrate-binding family protein